MKSKRKQPKNKSWVQLASSFVAQWPEVLEGIELSNMPIHYLKNLNIKLINTGQKSYTGERLKRVKKYIKGSFFLTYCDGLSNIDIKKTLLFFNKSKKIGLVSTINPKSRFGVLSIDRYNNVLSFDEKIKNSNTWINAGFFIFTKEIFKFITEKNAIFERGPLIKLSKKKQLVAYKHKGFWQCMDTLKDKILLTEIWNKKSKHIVEYCRKNYSTESMANTFIKLVKNES